MRDFRLKGFLQDNDPLKGATNSGTVFRVEVLGDTPTYTIQDKSGYA